MLKIFHIHLLIALFTLVVSDDLSQYLKTQTIKHSLLSKLDPNYYPFPKILWLYWDQEAMEPEILIFKQYYKQIIQNSGWVLNFVYNNNIQDFLSNQDEIDFILKYNEKIGSSQKSDYLRLSLLYEHGGLYVDFTSLFHQNLTWFTLQNLIKNPLILNKHPIHSPEPDILFTHQPDHGYRRVYKDNKTHYSYNDAPGYQSYFIAAKKNVQFLKDWKQKLKQYLLMQCQEVFFDLKNDDTYLGDFWYNCYYNVYFAMYNVLKTKQRQIDRNSSFFSRTNVHLHYKIWTFQCNSGPCIPFKGFFREYYFLRSQNALLQYTNLTKIELVSKFARWNIYTLKDIYKDSTKFATQATKGKNLKQIYQMRKAEFKDCSYMNYLNNQSVIYKKFHKYFHLLPYQIVSFSNQQCQNYWMHCHPNRIQQNSLITHNFNSFKEETQRIYEKQTQANEQFHTLFEIVVKARICWLLVIIIKKIIQVILADYNEQKNSNREMKQSKQLNIIQNQVSSQQTFLSLNYLKYPQEQKVKLLERIINSIHSILFFSYIQNFLQTKFPKFSQVITFCVGYQIGSLLVLRSLLQYSYTFKTEKQQYETIIYHMLFYFIIRKLNINQALTSKDNQNWFGFYSIESAMFKIVMSRIFLEMVYFQPQSVLFGSCYLYFALLVIEILEHEKTLFHFKFFLFIQKHRKHAKKVHQILFVMFLLSILLIPNLRYYQMFGYYLLQLTSNLTIVYAWILGFLIIFEQIFRLVCFKLFSKLSSKYFLAKRHEVDFSFTNSQRILSFYLTLLALSFLFDFIWLGYWRRHWMQHSFTLLKGFYFWFLSCSNYSIPARITYKNKRSHLFLSKLYSFILVLPIILIYYFRVYLVRITFNQPYNYNELMKQAEYYFSDLFVYIIGLREYAIFYVIIQSCFQIDQIINKFLQVTKIQRKRKDQKNVKV